MLMAKGKLVVFEGIDGAGLETQTKKLTEHLATQGVKVRAFDYPDYPSPVGRLIREYLYSDAEFPVNMQFLLHMADRAKDAPEIRECLRQGDAVVCNRYFTSILGYQCGQGFPLENALKIAEMFGISVPDYVFYLKISPKTSTERKNKEKAGNIDRNEKNESLKRQASAMYDRLARDNVFGRWYVIDGEKSVEDVFAQVRKVLGLPGR